MAESDTDNSNTQRRRNKIVVTGGVGGIAGALVIGGVIAFTSLLRYRANKKGSDVKNPNPESLKTSDVNDEGEGLRSLVQTQIDSDPEAEKAVEIPIMEDKPCIEGNEGIQISSTYQNHKIESGNTKPSTDAIREEVTDTIRQEVQLTGTDAVPLTSSDGVSALNVGKDLHVDDIHLLPSRTLKEETEYTDEEDDDDEQSEEEEEEDEDEMEREREDSEGTGDSSIGSNSEAIWPAESIDKELSLLKDRAPVKISGENEKISKAEEDEFELMNHLAMQEDSGYESIRHSSFLRLKLSLSMVLFLALGLFYLFFAHHVPLLFHLSNSQLSSS